MTEAERNELQALIAEWRAKAAAVGPQHTLWDAIADADALLQGKPTMLSGTPREVLQKLKAIGQGG